MASVSVWKSQEIKGLGWLALLIPFAFYGSVAALGFHFSGPRSDAYAMGLFAVVFFLCLYVGSFLYGLTKGFVKEIQIDWDRKKIIVARKPFNRSPVITVHEPKDIKFVSLNTYDNEISVNFYNGSGISLDSDFTRKISTSSKEFALEIVKTFDIPSSKFKEYFDGGGGGG